MNIAYKHLDAKLRIAELTLGQWAGLVFAVLMMIVYSTYLHPFGATFTLITTFYIGAVPVGAVILAGMSEINLWLLTRSALRWRHYDARYLPGPGDDTRGYQLEDTTGTATNGVQIDTPTLDLDALWSEQ
jgi:hypothetical protein